MGAKQIKLAERLEVPQDIRSKFVLLRIPVAAQVQQVTFSNALLKDVETGNILKIESYHASQVAVTPDGKALVTQAVHDKCYLYLRVDSTTVIRELALYDLSPNAAQLKVPAERLDLPTISLQDCYIAIADATGVTADTYFMLKITYIQG